VPLRRALQIEALTGGQVARRVRPACSSTRARGAVPPVCSACAAMVSACRLLMRAGQFRPSVHACDVGQCPVAIGCGLSRPSRSSIRGGRRSATRDARRAGGGDERQPLRSRPRTDRPRGRDGSG
jgi:hypothetical protein